MAQVTGIGGVFFRSGNPDELAAWYETHLGINPVPRDYDQQVWSQAEGPTVFAPFAADTEYFGRRDQAFMINFRVDDLDAMAAQLQEAGISVEIDKTEYPNGRFARLHDPDGNPIELWQPMGVDAS
ncbi:VOC family protein [uncultured Roseobacter sp.]|uniref:VOC family protein n=1 Tax=uncultured Roseobacter sp. TaxID=114847 RepID=UPI002636D1B5|nr:VOC family protein [uncultured Roseobacter sp.]